MQLIAQRPKETRLMLKARSRQQRAHARHGDTRTPCADSDFLKLPCLDHAVDGGPRDRKLVANFFDGPSPEGALVFRAVGLIVSSTHLLAPSNSAEAVKARD